MELEKCSSEIWKLLLHPERGGSRPGGRRLPTPLLHFCLAVRVKVTLAVITLSVIDGKMFVSCSHILELIPCR